MEEALIFHSKHMPADEEDRRKARCDQKHKEENVKRFYNHSKISNPKTINALNSRARLVSITETHLGK